MDDKQDPVVPDREETWQQRFTGFLGAYLMIEVVIGFFVLCLLGVSFFFGK